MKSTAGILMIVATVLGVPAGVFAQETSADASVAAVQRRLVAQEQLVRSKRWKPLTRRCASEIKRSAGLLLSAKGASMFTVSDADGFAESGGVAQPIVENERMRFAINTASAQRGRLNINSKLLSLAKIAKDNRNVRIP